MSFTGRNHEHAGLLFAVPDLDGPLCSDVLLTFRDGSQDVDCSARKFRGQSGCEVGCEISVDVIHAHTVPWLSVLELGRQMFSERRSEQIVARRTHHTASLGLVTN